MANLGKALRSLGRDAVGASKKRRQISSYFKKNGLMSLGKGGWLAHRDKDIVSGFVIEGSPLDTYISTFVLPAFDKHEFISWSLGGRVIHCSPHADTQAECKQAIDYYVANVADIKSSSSLVGYIDQRDIQGHYPIWVRYISYLRLFDFNSAVTYLDDSKRARLHPAQLAQLEEIFRVVAEHDADGVSRVFENWSTISERIFGPLDHAFDVL